MQLVTQDHTELITNSTIRELWQCPFSPPLSFVYLATSCITTRTSNLHSSSGARRIMSMTSQESIRWECSLCCIVFLIAKVDGLNSSVGVPSCCPWTATLIDTTNMWTLHPAILDSAQPTKQRKTCWSAQKEKRWYQTNSSCMLLAKNKIAMMNKEKARIWSSIHTWMRRSWAWKKKSIPWSRVLENCEFFVLHVWCWALLSWLYLLCCCLVFCSEAKGSIPKRRR